MKKMVFSYTLGVFLLVLSVMSFVQSTNTSLLAQADSMNIAQTTVSSVLAIGGSVFLALAVLIIILKTLNYRKKK